VHLCVDYDYGDDAMFLYEDEEEESVGDEDDDKNK
jgi:hypothetical protein